MILFNSEYLKVKCKIWYFSTQKLWEKNMKIDIFKSESLWVKIKKVEFKVNKFDIFSEKNKEKKFRNKILKCVTN